MQEILELNDLDRAIHLIFEEKIPFNHLLGVQVTSLKADSVGIRLDMREEFIGHFVHRVLHGGVTAAVLDLTGGLAAFVSVARRDRHRSFAEQIGRFNKLGTIDLRVDYLRPGRGEWFAATGYILRTGSKVAVTRTELHNNDKQLIAVGTAAYSVN